MNNFKIPFLKFSPLFLIISGALVIASLYLVIADGFQFGTDFTGGLEITLSFEDDITQGQLESMYKDAGEDPSITAILSGTNRFIIHASAVEEVMTVESNYKAVLSSNFTPDTYDIEKIAAIDATISGENITNAILISIIAIIAIIIYITLRFKIQYGIAAIIAVIHDVIIMLGVICFVGAEFNVLTITAILTIFGYSVNDTIVLFDRVREYIKENKILDYKELLNNAINSVLSRTLITSLTTITVVTCLLFVFMNDASDIKDFSFALLVGLISGTYSSIYVASGFMLLWNRFRPEL